MLKRIICVLTMLFIIISTCACSSEEKEEAKADDFSMTNVTTYEEKEIGSAIGLQEPGMKIGIDSKNEIFLNDYKRKDSFCSLVGADGKELQKFNNDFTGKALFTFDAQDNRYVVAQKSNSWKEGNKNWEVTYTLYIYNSKGEKRKFFDLGKQVFTEGQFEITDIAVDSKGTVYLLFRRGEIEVIGADGKKVKDIPAHKADYIEMDEEDNLFIGSFDGSNGHSSIEKRNTKNEDSIWTKEFPAGNYMSEMRYSHKNKTLYILSDKGVLCCSPNGRIGGFVLDLKQSSLLKLGIYISDFVFDSEKNIYILAFKRDLSSDTQKMIPLFYKYTPMKDEQYHKSQKTLSISLGFSTRYLDVGISKFQKAHPNIKIEVTNYSNTAISNENSLKEYEKNVGTELMVGKGADIIQMVLEMPYKKYVDKNALANISEIIKNDNSFDLSKYHQGILNACKYKNNLYIMPMSFIFPKIALNKGMMNKEGLAIDSTKLTWKELLSIAQKITRDKDGDGKTDQFALLKMPVEGIFSYMLLDENSKFVDFDTKTANFDCKEFIDILNLAKDFSDKNVCSPENIEKYPGKVGFMMFPLENYQSIVEAQYQTNGEVEFIGLPSYNGKRNSNVFYPRGTFAINNNSKMKAEAWEFIKFLLSDEIQSDPEMTDFPVNLKSLKKQAQWAISFNSTYYTYKDSGSIIKPVTQKEIDLVNKIISQAETIPYYDFKAENIIYDGAKEFFLGKKTAQEAAKQIQNKMSIYLGE